MNMSFKGSIEDIKGSHININTQINAAFYLKPLVYLKILCIKESYGYETV